jgi:hypothetical protein
VDTEYKFDSGDCVDILFLDSAGKPVTVEVETEVPPGNYVGMWQAVKYKHLAAVKFRLPCEEVRSILAAPRIPDDVRGFCIAALPLSARGVCFPAGRLKARGLPFAEATTVPRHRSAA